MESKAHHLLVKIIIDYALNSLGVKYNLIESDIFEVTGNITRMKEGYIPDFYYDYDNLTIIGEAKRESDLDREHSLKQYKSYISHLKYKASNGHKCVMIIATSWVASISAYKIFKKLLADENNIKLIVLNELGVYKEYEKNNFK